MKNGNYSPEFYFEMMMKGIPVKSEIVFDDFLELFQNIIETSEQYKSVMDISLAPDECLIYNSSHEHIASLVISEIDDDDYRLVIENGEDSNQLPPEGDLSKEEADYEEELSLILGNIIHLVLLLLASEKLLNTDVLRDMGFVTKVESILPSKGRIVRGHNENKSKLEEFDIDSTFI